MIPELSDICLWLVVAIPLVLVVGMPWVYARRGATAAQSVMQRGAWVIAVLAISTFAGLLTCYVTADFSLTNVAMNVSRAQPLMYKIAGVWSNHEGSMLLWLVVLCLGAAMMARSSGWTAAVKAWALWAQLGMIVVFAAFVVGVANPFARFWPVPKDGLGINPLLQDPSLLIHPPLLYAGLVGAAVILSWAWGAVLAGWRYESWARAIQPWVLGVWVCLTGGIALGSGWAYYELGWGGWWFWDPVENASLLPWLVITALMHSVRATLHGQPLGRISLWLAAWAFPLSTLGTVLTRSGVVTSVHAFAADATRGRYLAAILAGIVVLVAVLVWRGQRLPREEKMHWLGYRGVYAHVMCMILGMIVVAFGTVAPVIAKGFGWSVDVTREFYILTFVPVMMVMLVILGLGVVHAWGQTIGLAKLAPGVVGLTSVVVGLSLWYGEIMAALTYGMAIWVAGHSVVAWKRQRYQPVGMMLGHLGLAVAMVGMAAQTTEQREYVALLPVEGKVTVRGHEVTLTKVEAAEGPNYHIVRAVLTIRTDSKTIILTPEQWFFPVHEAYTTETAIHCGLAGDLYTALGQQRPDGRWEIRIYWNPLMWCLWLGAILMCVGGLVGIARRRLRG